MSKLMELGMSFENILLRCTKIPTGLMQGVVSGIKIGYPANMAVLKIEEGNYTFTDTEGHNMRSSRLIVPQNTIINGKLVYQRPK